MFKWLRIKIIQDELFQLYKDSHSAWQWAKDGPAHQRFAEKVDERIVMLEAKLLRLQGLTSEVT